MFRNFSGIRVPDLPVLPGKESRKALSERIERKWSWKRQRWTKFRKWLPLVERPSGRMSSEVKRFESRLVAHLGSSSPQLTALVPSVARCIGTCQCLLTAKTHQVYPGKVLASIGLKNSTVTSHYKYRLRGPWCGPLVSAVGSLP